jgi:hypothetical protein
LTSYDFNGTSLMHAMLAHILDHRSRGKKTGMGGPIEIPGFIMERATTARRGP